MARRDIHNELDRKNRNNHNDNYKELYRLKQVINDLVLDSGESDAEVVQARAGEETLNDRLDIMEDKTENVSKDMAELEEDLTKETEDRLQATLDEVEDIIQDLVEANEFNGVLLYKTKDEEIPSNSNTNVTWDKASYNTAGFWSSNDPTKITIPRGVKKVRLSGNVIWEANSDSIRNFVIRKNNEYTSGLPYVRHDGSGSTPTAGVSAVVEVDEGDFFTVMVRQQTGSSLNLREDPHSWFSLEVVEYSKK